MTDLLAALIEETPAKRWIRQQLDHEDKKFCVIWPFCRAQNGYPQVGKAKVTVTRIMCERRHGPPPTPRHQAAHSCNNGHNGCVNQWHLDWKTPAENQLDRPDRIGRSQRKLLPNQVDEIRRMKDRERTVDTAARFSVTEANVRQIQSGKTWRLDSRRRVFTDDEIRRIRAEPQANGVVKGFAKEFGVSLSCIHNIRNGTFYKHVTSQVSRPNGGNDA